MTVPGEKGVRLATLLVVLLVAITSTVSVTWLICWGVADRIIIDSRSQGLTAMQSGADAVGRQARLVLGPLDEIARMAAMFSGSADNFARDAGLREAMRASRLGVSEVRVIDHNGTELLHQGERHAPYPEGEPRIGFGQPWMDGAGEIVLRRTTRLESGALLELTLNPQALSEALSGVFPVGLHPGPTPSAGLERWDDGYFIARSEFREHHLDSGLRVGDDLLVAEHEHDSGSRPALSTTSGQPILLGFRVLDDLGLVASAVAPADDALARLQTHPWRRAPFVLLLLEVMLAGLTVGLVARHRGRAALSEQSRKASVEAAARAALEDLVRCSPAMLYRGRLDAQANYQRVYATPNSKALTGWDPEPSFDLKKHAHFAAPEDRDLLIASYLSAYREGRASAEYRCLRPEGGYVWLRNEVVVVQRYGDGTADVVGALTNVTLQRRLAAQAAQTNRMATLGELATSIAHELSQPVTVISMSASLAQILVEDDDRPASERMAEIGPQIDAVLTQGQRAGEIIRHLRGYGHAGGGEVGPVDIGKAVDGALVLAGRPLAEASVVVEMDLPGDLPKVRGRLIQVEQVLLNLMINARDAMKAVPAERRRLRIFAALEDEEVVIHIADSGPGVAPEAIGWLFEPFFTTKAVGEGTGLGLSLCRSMMEGFGGAISMRNAEVGVVFSLRFARVLALSRQTEPARV